LSSPGFFSTLQFAPASLWPSFQPVKVREIQRHIEQRTGIVILVAKARLDIISITIAVQINNAIGDRQNSS
jgi:hypothetical protein